MFNNSFRLCVSFLIVQLISIAFMANICSARNPDIFTRIKKPLPQIKLMEQDEFIKKTKIISKEPYGEKALYYTMRVDKTWTEGEDKSGGGNFILSEKLFLDLNVFYGNPTISGRSRIEVEALNMDGNLTVEQWYIKYILEGGYTTQGLVVHNPQKVESLMVIMERDYSFYLRTMITMNGSKVIMVKYYVPIQNIQEQAAMQAQVLKSFRLKRHIERPEPELETYRFLDVAEVQYPLDWKLFARKMRTVDRMDVSVINLKEVATEYSTTSITEGKVYISLVSSSVNNTLIEEIANYKKTIEGSGVLIGEKLPVDIKFKYDEAMTFNITEVYLGVDGTKNLNEYEFWFSVIVGGNYYYFLTLLTPSRNEDFAAWAENTQSYQIILEKFKPMVGAFLERD